MRNPKFTTKEEYLQYRKDWKKEYMVLSQMIRDYKTIRNLRNKECNKAMQMIGGMLNYDNVNKYFKYVEQNIKENFYLQSLIDKYKGKKTWLEKQRKEANKMMEELKDAKIEANRQYLASKQLINV